MKTLADFDWRGKTAVLRTDLNVPLAANGAVADNARLAAAVPTVRTLIEGGGGVCVLSHLGRPPEGEVDAALSLAPVAAAFSAELRYPVRFCRTLEGGRAAAGEVVLMENTRFNVGERANDGNLARRYAALGDVFVMDAFASAHRAEASVAALANAGLPVCAGALLAAELQSLQRVMENIERPLVGIFGGAKISTKLALLRRMAGLCDVLLIGGGMANTLLFARGDGIGASLVQRDMCGEARAVLAAAKRIVLPQDVVAGDGGGGAVRCLPLAQIAAEDCILDIGSATCAEFARHISAAKTILWNGPLGLFERREAAAGTRAVAQAVAGAAAYSIIGGADTIAAVRAAGVIDEMSYVSTGGGALLEYLAGKRLPGLEGVMSPRSGGDR